MAVLGAERLAVVDPLEPSRLVGVVSRSDLFKPALQVYEDEFKRESRFGVKRLKPRAAIARGP